MQIKIQTTVKEIRELGKLTEFCELFHYDVNTVADDSPVVMTMEQARKISLPLPWDSEIQKLPTPTAAPVSKPKAKQTKKSK
jgi:hypothetical protein